MTGWDADDGLEPESWWHIGWGPALLAATIWAVVVTIAVLG